MSKQDKLFIAHRTGRWTLSIVPRTAAGWRALILWMLSLAPITGAFIWFANAKPEGALLWLGLAAYLTVMTLWGVGMIRWMLARSERVDMDDFYAFKRQQEEDRRRHGNRP